MKLAQLRKQGIDVAKLFAGDYQSTRTVEHDFAVRDAEVCNEPKGSTLGEDSVQQPTEEAAVKAVLEGGDAGDSD